MKPKGRYNIGVARRHGVEVRFSSDERDIPLFYRIFEQTAAGNVSSASPMPTSSTSARPFSLAAGPNLVSRP